jgi:hypothetical protein
MAAYQKHKHWLTTLGRSLFLVLFVFYGISPLSYSFDAASARNMPHRAGEQSAPGIYVLSLLCQQVQDILDSQIPSEGSTFNAANDDDDLFLAKKRRAVASTRKYVDKVEQVGWVLPDDRRLDLQSSACAFVPRTASPRDHNGYSFINSGLSPPST